MKIWPFWSQISMHHRYLKQNFNPRTLVGFSIVGIESPHRLCKKLTQWGDSLDSFECYGWLRDNFWFKKSYSSLDMICRIEEEPHEIFAYSNFVQMPVTKSGLWVNIQIIHLYASPDGLPIDCVTGRLMGIIELKCLKPLR